MNSVNVVNGYVIAADYRCNSNVLDFGDYGYCWSSTDMGDQQSVFGMSFRSIEVLRQPQPVPLEKSRKARLSGLKNAFFYPDRAKFSVMGSKQRFFIPL